MATESARRRCRERVVAISDEPGDPFTLRFRIVELLRPVVGFDRWCWPICDPGSGLGTTAVGEHDYWAALPRLLLLEQRMDEADTLAVLANPRSTDTRDPGLRFIDVLEPLGIGDELRVPLRDRHGLWGCLDVMRSFDDPPFGDEEAGLLDDLTPALAKATRRSAAAVFAGPVPSSSPAPGVLVLDADLAVRASTSGARAWLAELAPSTLPFAEMAAHAVVFNVASRVVGRAFADGMHRGYDATGPARARVQSTTGAWAVVEADALDPFESTVAVTIRPAAGEDVLDLRLLAYDLSARERELVALVLAGSDTRAVSERMFISPHTVQDHLKSVFGKVGVHTRKELVATLSGATEDRGREPRTLGT